jgi:hypothetical protein
VGQFEMDQIEKDCHSEERSAEESAVRRAKSKADSSLRSEYSR